LQLFLTQEQEEQREQGEQEEQGEQGELEEQVNGCKKKKIKKSFSQHKALQELSHEAHDAAVILSILEQKTCHLVQYMVLSFCAKIWQ
jgi:hypothetical protein